MSYLIFGLVVMFITWWITNKNSDLYLDKKESIILDLVEMNSDLILKIRELESELITQKAMKGE